MAQKQDLNPVEVLFDREEHKVQEARVKAQEFAIVLLDPNFNEARFYELLGDLNVIGYDRAAVIQCMLSRLTFHEALGDNGKYRDRWVKGLAMLEVTVVEINDAIREGQELMTALNGKSKDEIALVVYQRYFNSAEPPPTITLITPVEEALETVESATG